MTTQEIDLATIDPAPARAVRSALNEEAVERYLEAYQDGQTLPPVVVFSDGKGCNKLAAGSHRHQARHEGGFSTITAIVHLCKDADEATEQAIRYAAGDNTTHGLPRTAEDKRAAVRAIIGLESLAEASDREIAEIAKVRHHLVRMVREELTAKGKLDGPAAATNRDYKPTISARGGYVTDGKGGTVPVAKAEPADELPTDEPTTEKKTVAIIKDAKGRIVPTNLLPVFGDVDVLERAITSIKAACAVVESRSADPVCGALSVNNLTASRDSLIGDLESARPYVVCPACDGTTKKLPAGPNRPTCGTCSGRGWISKGGWPRLSEDLKAKAKEAK